MGHDIDGLKQKLMTFAPCDDISMALGGDGAEKEELLLWSRKVWACSWTDVWAIASSVSVNDVWYLKTYLNADATIIINSLNEY